MAAAGVASVASWAIIFRKRRVISQLAPPGRPLRDRLLVGRRSGARCTAASRPRARPAPACRASSSPASASSAACGSRATPADQLLEGARRAMRVAQLREIDRLEHNLATLATSVRPARMSGLFGTVWGIMSAFHNLGNVQQATLAAVAPGHLRGADHHGDRPVRGHSRGGGLQPLRRPGEPPGTALRHLHGGVLDHPAAPRADRPVPRR